MPVVRSDDVRPVEEAPGLPSAPTTADKPVATWAGGMVSRISKLLREFAGRVNATLPKDGTEPMTGPLPLARYTVATLPAAADAPWTVVAVTDGGAGAEVRASNGAAWVNLG